MSTTDTRAAFKEWHIDKFGLFDDSLWPTDENRYASELIDGRWAAWQAATEAAKPEQEGDIPPPRYSYSADGKTVTLENYDDMMEGLRRYRAEAAKATGTAGELPPLPETTYLGGDEAYGDRVDGYTADQMREYGQACAEAARQPAPVVAVTRIETGYGNYLEFERKTSGKSGWLVRNEKGELVRALTPTEVLLVDSAIAATNRSQP